MCWHKASDEDLQKYKQILDLKLDNPDTPGICCRDMQCCDLSHRNNIEPCRQILLVHAWRLKMIRFLARTNINAQSYLDVVRICGGLPPRCPILAKVEDIRIFFTYNSKVSLPILWKM